MSSTILDYHSPSSTYALAFSPLSSTNSIHLAVASHNESSNSNDITIIGSTPSITALDELDVIELAKVTVQYPCTKIGFSPLELGLVGNREIVASSSDCLRLWDLSSEEFDQKPNSRIGRGRNDSTGKMTLSSTLANSKTDYAAPLTGFSWSTLEPKHIVTASIDTTCTVWDISTSTPVTQLIAHDKEVYDVAWSPSTASVFASVGADGSVRMFDLRALEHSTILYEATAKSSETGGPLLRLAFSQGDSNYLSVFHSDDKVVKVLDIRNPGVPWGEISGHRSNVNGMAWGNGSNASSGPGWIATCSDDHTLLLYDLSNSSPPVSTPVKSKIPPTRVVDTPLWSYTAPSEINNIAWGATNGGSNGWIAAGCGRLVQILRV